jgi:hypothetical protein
MGKVADTKMPAVPAKKREPTAEEAAAVETLFARRRKRPPAPSLKFSNDGGTLSIGTDHEDNRLGLVLVANAVGAADDDFSSGLIGQLLNAGMIGKGTDARGPNFMLSVVKAVEPRDELEAMLAAQMAAVHMATMRVARTLAHIQNIPQQDSASNAFNKLTRTFAAQMEALKRYRSGGEQKVTVRHVTVNEGGQAIVGVVAPPPGRGV